MQSLILDSVNKSLKAKLGEAATTQPSFVVSYAKSYSNDVIEAANDGAFNSTTNVTLVDVPASADERRIVKDVTIYNGDNISHIVTLIYDNNATERVLWSGTLTPGQTFSVRDFSSFASTVTGVLYTQLTDGATINIDHSLNTRFYVTLGGNRTLTLSNPVNGKPILIDLIQDGTGSRTITWFSKSSTFATSDVNTGTEVITVGRNIPTGTPITFTSSTTLPAGLAAATTYYAINDSSTTIKVASSLANAQAGTAINITDQGTGTHTVYTQIRWAGGAAPTLSTGKYLKDSFGIMPFDVTNGIYHGYIIGQAV